MPEPDEEPAATINLQWKGTDACYDFYCPCGWEGPAPGDDPEAEGNHRDGFFMQDFQCGGCGRWWQLPNEITAKPGRFYEET